MAAIDYSTLGKAVARLREGLETRARAGDVLVQEAGAPEKAA